MKNCVLFGHRDAPEGLDQAIEEAIGRVIREEGITEFRVGNQGEFDRAALRVLRKLKAEGGALDYAVVLPYLPAGGAEFSELSPEETVFPDGLEGVPRRFAIDRRNRLMVERCDCVIAYVRRSIGGAGRAVAYAERLGKKVIYL